MRRRQFPRDLTTWCLVQDGHVLGMSAFYLDGSLLQMGKSRLRAAVVCPRAVLPQALVVRFLKTGTSPFSQLCPDQWTLGSCWVFHDLCVTSCLKHPQVSMLPCLSYHVASLGPPAPPPWPPCLHLCGLWSLLHLRAVPSLQVPPLTGAALRVCCRRRVPGPGA